MTRLFAILIACVVALASYGPRTSMALEWGSSSAMTAEMAENTGGAETQSAAHSNMDCCTQPTYGMSDLHGHCGMSCAIMSEAISPIHPWSVASFTAGEPAGLVTSNRDLPERPPRTFL